MIKYKKGWWGINLLRQISGTSWPHGVLPGLASASLGLLLGLVPEINDLISNEEVFIDNPYPYQLFAYLLGFLLVFHTNFGYSRYWEAMDAVQRMGAKWLDGACMAIAFDAKGDASHPFLQASLPPRGGAGGATHHIGEAVFTGGAMSPSRGVEHSEYFVEIVHLFSLIHALALMHLRGDTDLDHLGEPAAIAAPEGGGAPRNYEKLRGSPTNKAGSSPKGQMHEEEDDPPLTFGVHRFANCLPSSWRKLPGLRLKVLGGFHADERMKLSCDSQGRPLPTVARVTMVESWIMRRMIARQKHEPAGDMCKTGPPILSRMVQVVSDGNLGFGEASKSAEIPFPFPYHNLIRAFLWLFSITVPAVINSKVMSTIPRFVFNFLTVWAYFALAEVSDNIEDPYLPYDANDLPLGAIQHSFNARLMAFGEIPRSEPKPSCRVISQ